MEYIPEINPGEKITAEWLNRLVRACNRRIVGAGVFEGANETAIAVASSGNEGAIAFRLKSDGLQTGGFAEAYPLLPDGSIPSTEAGYDDTQLISVHGSGIAGCSWFGAYGWCQRSENSLLDPPSHEIICLQTVFVMQVGLAVNLGADDSSASVGRAFPGDLGSGSISANNPYHLSGIHDEVDCTVIWSIDSWVLTNITPSYTTFITDVDFEAATGKWRKKTREVNINPRYDASDWIAYITGVSTPSDLQRDDTTVVCSADPSTSVYGQTVTLYATVSKTAGDAEITGYVVFFADGTPLDCEPASVGSGGECSTTCTKMPAGATSLTCKYMGDSSYKPSIGSSSSITIDAADTTTALTADSTSIHYGDNVTLTATVTPVAPSTAGEVPRGYVTFYNGEDAIGTASMAGTVNYCSLGVNNLQAGSPSLTAVYAPARNYATSTSDALEITVAKLPLRVRASDMNRPYGASNPSFAWTLETLTGASIIATWTGAPDITTTATLTSPVNDDGYPITPAIGTLASDNYSFTDFAAGTLHLTTAPLTISANSLSVVVGSAIPAYTYSISGVLNGDTITVDITCTYDDTSGVGTYAIVPSASDSNYVITTGQVKTMIIVVAIFWGLLQFIMSNWDKISKII